MEPDGLGADEVWQPLRWRDLDYFGHVYHAEFLTLLDEARGVWLGRRPRLRDPESYVVARLEIDYLSPVTREDRGVRVAFALEHVGTTSLTLRETMYGGYGREVARTRTVVVLWDREQARSRPLDEDERSRAEALA